VSELVEKRDKVSEEENLTVVATPDLGESQTRLDIFTSFFIT